jgi:hydroxyethylthiazole kinase-like uncharacterized protein yjeF
MKNPISAQTLSPIEICGIMKPISFLDMREYDRNAVWLGVPEESLMENAGKGAAEIIAKRYDIKGKRVLIVGGTGNNTGDGCVVARYLKKMGADPIIFLLKGHVRSELSNLNLKRAREMGIHIYEREGLSEWIRKCDIIVDALLGIGVTGNPREPYRSAIEMMNSSGKPVISIDVPSGIGYEPHVEPELTITFDSPKEGMEENVEVVDIGIPKEAKTYVGPGAFVRYPRLRKDAHKGDGGRIMIIGGGPYHGAPIMAGKAAYRAGSDLVYLTVPERIYPIVAGACDNFIVFSEGNEVIEESAVDRFLSMQEKLHAVLIGPGIGRDERTKRAVEYLTGSSEIPMVIDADALHLIESDNLPENTVITPHRGEFKAMFGVDVPDDLEERKELVKEMAEKHNIIIVLKGPVDVISDGKNTALNRTGVPRMAVGGTGDVLSGTITSLIGRGMEPYHAARLGAFINGYAGELAFKEKSCGMMATDVIEKIPEVLKEFL